MPATLPYGAVDPAPWTDEPSFETEDQGLPEIFVGYGTAYTHRAFSVFNRATPNAVLQGQVAPGWKLIRDLAVNVEQAEDGHYVASDDVFLVYGEGITQAQAIDDYIRSLIEYYDIITENSSDGNPETEQLRGFIGSYLAESHP